MEFEMDQKIETTFDAQIRDAWVHVEAYGMADHSGIWRTGITGVYIEGADVSGLLTADDWCALDAMIEPAIANDASEEQLTREMGFGPSAV